MVATRARQSTRDIITNWRRHVIGPISVLGAPSGIGIRPYDQGGIRRLDLAPGVLRKQHLVERLGATDRGDVMPPLRYQDATKPVDRVRNEADVLSYSDKLADRVADLAQRNEFVLALGGDCSILLGALSGLRRDAGLRPGLIYVDAHSDFATFDETPSGSACSMNLALAVGRASGTPLARLAGDPPLVDAGRVMHVGARDVGEPYGHPALETFGVAKVDGDHITKYGVLAAARTALSHMTEAASDGFWIAVDVDVLDPRVMPAVDTPQPGGLTYPELTELLAPLVQHPLALGLQVTIYDPTLDPGLEAAAHLVDAVVKAFTEPSA
jgi:arginase